MRLHSSIIKRSKNKTKIEQYHLHKDQPQKLQFEIFSLNEYLQKNIGLANKPHIHSFYQIIWFTKGNGKHFVDFNEFEVSVNKIFFISKNQIHYFDSNLNYEGHLIHFNESFLLDCENDIDIFLKYNIFNDFENEPVFTIPTETIEKFGALVASLKQELSEPSNFAHKDFLKHLLKMFLISIQRLRKRNKSKKLALNNQIIHQKFRQAVEINYKTLHTVKEYANILNISSKTLTNHTTEISFKTPLEIINDRIILEAKRQLSHSNLNINEIGFQLGYEDPSYFAKFFKRQTKMSPGDFRKQIS